MTAKALSIQQPWAWAITDLDKRVENRSKPTSYRGEVFLHASAKARPIDDLVETLDQWPQDATRAMHAWMKREMPLGAIVGVARITDCICAAHGTAKDSGDRWLEGPWAYVLDEVVKLPTPVPCKGALQIWKVSPKVEAEVRRQLEMAKVDNVTPEEQRQRVEAAATAVPTTTPEPSPDAHQELGYGPPPPEGYSPQQQEWFKLTFKEIDALDLARQDAKGNVREIQEELDDAKDGLKAIESQIHDLGVRLREIHANTYVPAQVVDKPPLPGMGTGHGQDAAKGAEPAPEPAPAAAEGKPTDVCECGHPRSDHEGGDGSCMGGRCAQSEDDGCLEFVLKNEAKPTDVCVCDHPRSCHPDNGPCQDADCKNGCGGFVPLPPEQAAKPAEEIPADLMNTALEHVVVCHEKGKGLDVNSLSLVLFSNRKKENRPRCEAILARLVRDGLIVADESSPDGKARYLPAGKE